MCARFDKALFVGVTPFPCHSFSFRALMFVNEGSFLAFVAISCFAYTGARDVEECVPCSVGGYYIRNVILWVACLCCWTLKMWNGPYARGINLLYVGLSVLAKLLDLTARGGLSTNTNSFGLKTGFFVRVDCNRAYFAFERRSINCQPFALLKANLAKTQSHNRRRNILQDKLNGIADGKLIVFASGGWPASTRLNGDTAMDRWT